MLESVKDTIDSLLSGGSYTEVEHKQLTSLLDSLCKNRSMVVKIKIPDFTSQVFSCKGAYPDMNFSDHNFGYIRVKMLNGAQVKTTLKEITIKSRDSKFEIFISEK